MLRTFRVILFLSFAASPAYAVDPPKTNVFVPEVASGNMFEIESSKLALAKTKAEPVRAFANAMVTDHTQAGAKFRQALTDAKIKPPAEGLDAKHKSIVDDLRKKDGATFDKAYVEAQYKAHTETVALVEAYATGGDNPRLKQFAQEVLPTLRAHLEQVSKLR